MIKKNRSEYWENTANFDKTTGQYIRLNSENWIKDNKIREIGSQRGQNNLPSQEEVRPDETYQNICAFVEKQATNCKQAVQEYVDDHLATFHQIESTWRKENPAINLGNLIDRGCQDIEQQTEIFLGDLANHQVKYNEAFRDLQKFRDRNSLLRVAHYPSNFLAHWLWIGVAIIVESFLSANLLGSVSRGGVIEGWVVALALTAANVVVGILAGHSLRYTNLRLSFLKISHTILTLVFGTLALAWNIIAGHVRDIYHEAEETGQFEALDQAFAAAFSKLLDQPLPWESLESATLALVGIAVFIATTYKSYKSDDPFPEYGAKYRKAEALHDRYHENLNKAIIQLNSIRDNTSSEIEEIKARYETDLYAWETTVDRLNSIRNNYETNLALYNKDLNFILSAYTTSNLAARKTTPPAFFQDESKISEKLLEPPEFRIPDHPDWGDIPKKTKQGIARVHDTFEKQAGRFQMLYHKIRNLEKMT